MDISLSYLNAGCDIDVSLPYSKSIVNRLAIINALAGNIPALETFSSCDDTDIILGILGGGDNREINVGASGTALRFLLSYFALEGRGDRLITGTERLCKRPVGALADVLKGLGADISYAGREGYPPVVIKGGINEGGDVAFADGSISSQYISSLMLVAPYMKGGLVIHLPDKMVSLPYINMTAEVMKAFGATVMYDGTTVKIKEGAYCANPDFEVPRDWSAASYWYELVSVIPDLRVRLKGMAKSLLNGDNPQGDARLVDIFGKINVSTSSDGDDIVIVNNGRKCSELLDIDMSSNPDIVPALAVACLMNGTHFSFSGVGHLKYKESNRISAMTDEAAKAGFVLSYDEGSEEFYWDGTMTVPSKSIIFETYNDHRITMSLSAMAYRFGNISIRDAGNVSKSYKTFWKDMETAGFIIKEKNI